MTSVGTHTYVSPVGTLRLGFTEKGLACISLGGDEAGFASVLHRRFGKEYRLVARPVARPVIGKPGGGFNLTTLCRLLDRYFSAEAVSFDIPIDTDGTDFEESVWGVLREIPFGSILSYGEVAARAGSPGAARAAGTACAKNPLPIVIPCRRVVLATGGLGGFSAGTGGEGVRIKRALLEIEGSFPVA